MKTVVLSTSSNETDKYAESLEAFGPVNTLRYDIVGGSDQILFDKAKEFAPDLIVYIGSRWGKQPSIATLCRIQSKIAPSVHICSDAADPPWHDLLREYHEKGAFTLQVAIDGNDNWPGAKTGLTLLTPVDWKYFPEIAPMHENRTILCGFAGNTGGGPLSQRTILLTQLLEKRAIDMRVRSPLPHTYEGYCEYLTRCKISLNIAYSGTEATKQVKGRVVETALAGAVLLETKGAPTSRWFETGRDFMEYGSAEEAVEIIEHLRKAPFLARDIAMNLRARMKAEHSPDVFWNKIFGKLGVRP